MNKKIFHLVGMPRAGNTVLGGIINQNPNLQVSPLSPLSRTVSTLHQSFEGEAWENFDWSSEQDSLARKTAQAWYSDFKADSIIDRGMWFPEVVKRLMRGRFTLDDLYYQLKSIKKVGKFNQIMAMMGGGNVPDALKEGAEKTLKNGR